MISWLLQYVHESPKVCLNGKAWKTIWEKKRQDQSGSKFIRGFFKTSLPPQLWPYASWWPCGENLTLNRSILWQSKGENGRSTAIAEFYNWDQLRLVQVQKLSARTKNKRWALPCGKWSKKVAKEPDSWEFETQRQQSQASNCSRFSFHSFASDAHLLAVALLMCRMWPGDALHKCYQRVVTRTHAMQVRWGELDPAIFFEHSLAEFTNAAITKDVIMQWEYIARLFPKDHRALFAAAGRCRRNRCMRSHQNRFSQTHYQNITSANGHH